ncbi:MAG: hypothetical protein V3W41_04980 [Planctomycetota bacterium]
MLRISHTTNEDANIEGDASDWLALRRRILALLDGAEVRMLCKAAIEFDPAPYESVLSHLEIGRTKANMISVRASCLVVNGDDDFLSNLASNLPTESDSTASGVSYHVHYDWISFGDFLAENSMGVILTLWEGAA